MYIVNLNDILEDSFMIPRLSLGVRATNVCHPAISISPLLAEGLVFDIKTSSYHAFEIVEPCLPFLPLTSWIALQEQQLTLGCSVFVSFVRGRL